MVQNEVHCIYLVMRWSLSFQNLVQIYKSVLCKLAIKWGFSLQKQSKRSSSILQDGPVSLKLFWEDFQSQRSLKLFCKGKPASYNEINRVDTFHKFRDCFEYSCFGYTTMLGTFFEYCSSNLIYCSFSFIKGEGKLFLTI